MKNEHICGLCIVQDNRVLFVKKDNRLSFPVVSYLHYTCADAIHSYGLKTIGTSKKLGIYTMDEHLKIEVFGMATEIEDYEKYQNLLSQENMLFMDIDEIEDYLCRNITLDDYRNQVDRMITNSIHQFREIEEGPKQMKLVITEK